MPNHNQSIGLRVMPQSFRHYVKWLISQIDCNIYTVHRCLPAPDWVLSELARPMPLKRDGRSVQLTAPLFRVTLCSCLQCRPRARDTHTHRHTHRQRLARPYQLIWRLIINPPSETDASGGLPWHSTLANVTLSKQTKAALIRRSTICINSLCISVCCVISVVLFV